MIISKKNETSSDMCWGTLPDGGGERSDAERRAS